MKNLEKRNKVRGAILGTAIGDALGMPIEGLKPAVIKKYYGEIKSYCSPNKKCYSLHNLKRGQWTDDTQLMLAIGESIIERGHIDYVDIISRHANISDHRGWGKATTNSIQRYMSGYSWNNSGEVDAAGNGPPMKIAPIGVLYGLEKIDDFEMLSIVINISRMTHKDARATVAAILQTELIGAAIRFGIGGLKLKLEQLYTRANSLERVFYGLNYNRKMLSTKIYKSINLARSGVIDSIIREEIGTGAFVNQSYAFICAMLYKYLDDPINCIEKTINQGGDCDTTGAMVGAVVGAIHGYKAFPYRWKRSLEDKQRLITLADGLWRLDV